MTPSKISLSLFFAVALLFSASCSKDKTPSSSTLNPNYLYLTIYQYAPGCPLTLTVTGPTSFSDVLDTRSIYASQIALNYTSGGYVFALNGASDGVTHNLSGAETITYTPLAPISCPGWSYTVKP